MNNLTLITPTGDRSDAFSLCVKYVNRQTRQPDQWIIVDDGVSDETSIIAEQAECPVTYIRLEPIPGKNTLNRNLRAALNMVNTNSNTAFFEDDDWYPANYLEELEKMISQGFHNVGANRHLSYNIASQCFRSFRQSKTMCTHSLGFDPYGLDFFRNEIVFAFEIPSVDMLIGKKWDYSKNGLRGHLTTLPVHICGFGNGRRGTTRSHRAKPGGKWRFDTDWQILKKWIGPQDAEIYIRERTHIIIVLDTNNIMCYITISKHGERYDENSTRCQKYFCEAQRIVA